MEKIGFIGAGNMANNLIHGLIKAGMSTDRIIASDTATAQLEKISALGIHTTPNNVNLVSTADIVVLALKPQVMPQACRQISSSIQRHRPLVVSIAAGLPIHSIQAWLGTDTLPVIRVMPNTPALVGQGMSALYTSTDITTAQRQSAEYIFNAAGETLWLKNEQEMDVVTAVSGSGPAYYFLLMEAMTRAATKQGLDHERAQQLVLQTALGAATMASQSGIDPGELRNRVTSPGGTTEKAIHTFLQSGFIEIIEKAVQAATDRSVELSEKLAES